MRRVSIYVLIIMAFCIYNSDVYASSRNADTASQYLKDVTIYKASGDKVVLNAIRKDANITIRLNVSWSYTPGFLKTTIGNIAAVSVLDTKNEYFTVHKFEFLDGSVIIGCSDDELLGLSKQKKYSIKFRDVRNAFFQDIQKNKFNHSNPPTFSVMYRTEFEGFKEQTVNLNTLEYGYDYSTILSRDKNGITVYGPLSKKLGSIPFKTADGIQLSIPLKDVISLELDYSRDQLGSPHPRVLRYKLAKSDSVKKIAGTSPIIPINNEHTYDAEGHLCGNDWRGTWQFDLEMVVSLRRLGLQPLKPETQ